MPNERTVGPQGSLSDPKCAISLSAVFKVFILAQRALIRIKVCDAHQLY
jgi:hypothetical protein